MRFTLTSFAAIAAATLAYAQPHARAGKSINPNIDEIPGVMDWSSIAAPAPEPNTNAKRFAMHLPPLSPRARHHHPQRAAPHRLGTRVQAAPRAQTSPLPPVNQECNILVKTEDEILGYLAPYFNAFGEYGKFQPDQDGALLVSFPYSADSPSQIDFLATNGPTAAYPFAGAAMGWLSDSNNLGSGSYNWAYIAGVPQTPPGSPAVAGNTTFAEATGIPADYQSAIWNFNPESKEIKAQWINTDGSAPNTQILYANDGNDALLITGDKAALWDGFGVTYPGVMLTCMPPATKEPARH